MQPEEVDSACEPYECSDVQSESMSVEEQLAKVFDLAALSESAKIRYEIVCELTSENSQEPYKQRLAAAAKRAGMSISTLKRWKRNYLTLGLPGILNDDRTDKGDHRIDAYWLNHIKERLKYFRKNKLKVVPTQIVAYVTAVAKSKEYEDLKEPAKKPSDRTVRRVVATLLPTLKKVRHAGRSPADDPQMRTDNNETLVATHSNRIWQCDCTPCDVLAVDDDGTVLGRLTLITIVDCYSRCIVGFSLSFDPPSFVTVTLALRHAILTKSYPPEYELENEWQACGTPDILFTDKGPEFKNAGLRFACAALGISCEFRLHPSEGGLIESPFKTLVKQFFSGLPGYTGSNVVDRPKDTENYACIMASTLERMLVRYIVDNYNRKVLTQFGAQRRIERWIAGLVAGVSFPDENRLNYCLARSTTRKVQAGGRIVFENLMYRGERLQGLERQTVILKYDPRDISTVAVYATGEKAGVYHGQAHAEGFEGLRVSLVQIKATTKRLREEGKAVDNGSSHREILGRNTEIENSIAVRDRRRRGEKNLNPLSKTPKAVEEDPLSETDPLLPALPKKARKVW